MYVCASNSHLISEPQRGGEAEGAPRLRPPQLGQVLALELHDDVVEAVVAAAPDEAAHVLAALQLLQHGHLHLEHLLRLLRRLQLQRHLRIRHSSFIALSIVFRWRATRRRDMESWNRARLLSLYLPNVTPSGKRCFFQ